MSQPAATPPPEPPKPGSIYEPRARRQRKDRTAASSLTLSLVMHGILFLVVFVWAAKTGRLDPVLKAFDVVLDKKEKKAEPKKEEPKQQKPEEKKPEEQPKLTAPPPIQNNAAPPPSDSAPAVAPPPAVMADFAFSDGAKVVESSTNAPVLYYKNMVEFTLRSNWERPGGIADDAFVAMVEVRMDAKGNLLGNRLKQGSGNSKWDDSVRQALKSTKSVDQVPPPGFPMVFDVRFDVLPATEPLQ